MISGISIRLERRHIRTISAHQKKPTIFGCGGVVRGLIAAVVAAEYHCKAAIVIGGNPAICADDVVLIRHQVFLGTVDRYGKERLCRDRRIGCGIAGIRLSSVQRIGFIHGVCVRREAPGPGGHIGKPLPILDLIRAGLHHVKDIWQLIIGVHQCVPHGLHQVKIGAFTIRLGCGTGNLVSRLQAVDHERHVFCGATVPRPIPTVTKSVCKS